MKDVMNFDIDKDTIAACATSPGIGGIGIIRVSGPKTKAIAKEILDRVPKPRYARQTKFFDKNGIVIDQGIAIYFSAPHSFTGEDVLELHAHGGQVVLDSILERTIELGARLAKPGEFSERAFLNGKIDLVQAEAIADLINATSTEAAQNAMRSLEGEFSQYIYDIMERITGLRVAIEAAIDFTEEEIENITLEKITSQLADILYLTQKTKDAAKQGVLLQEGMSVVISGKPNVGKSSLFNSLSGEEAAIVTEIAGTTRDVLKAQVKLDGIILQLIDTAGLRELSNDAIEKEGIKRAKAEIAKAQHVLLVVDITKENGKSKEEILMEYDYAAEIGKCEKPNCNNKYTVVFNKIDLLSRKPELLLDNDIYCVFVSAKTKEGIDLLRKHLYSVSKMQQTIEGTFSARRRHLLALDEAQKHLLYAEAQTQNNADMDKNSEGENLNLELIAEELRAAQQSLGEIIGEVTTEDLLTKIFREFCVGK